ncbi:MAG: MFS transporter, partial [Anaerolineae bacterium]|nr:MFS transporter [Anaerolineae bacterium]
MKKNVIQAWGRLVALMFSSVVFSIPYILWTLYVPMQTALNVDHSKLAYIMTVYGAVAIPSYLFGGFIADKFNPTKLISFSLLGVGLLGFYYSTIPSYNVILVIQFFMALLSIGCYFPALIKATRFVSDNLGQSLGFGALEGGRKLSYFVFNAIFIYFFTRAGEGVNGFKAALVTISVQCLVMSVIVFFAFKGVDYNKMVAREGEKVDLSKVIPLLKKPAIWLIALTILLVYVSSTVQGYVTSYLVNVFEMGEAQSAWFFSFTQFAAPLIVVLGGWLTNKAGIDKGMLVSQALLVLTIIGLLLVPTGPAYLLPAMASLLIFLVALYVVRGLYWALVDYAKIPKAVTGTALGVMMMICYTPDFFTYNVAGNILDANPGAAGYKIVFAVMLV